MIGSARPCPVSITDQMPNTMIPQWHRGSPWAVEHARALPRRSRATSGEPAPRSATTSAAGSCGLAPGLWHDPGFYTALEQRYGAVFVWSMYMPFAGPQYIRELQGRPLHALASRICSMNEVLHLPPWMNRLDAKRSAALRDRRRHHARAARQPAVAIRHVADAASARSRRRTDADALRGYG